MSEGPPVPQGSPGEVSLEVLQHLKSDIVREISGVIEWRAAQVEQAVVRELVCRDHLVDLLHPPAHIPPAGGWAASYEVIHEIVLEIQQARPPVVLEFGSGVSTAWLALALAATGGRLVSVEHDAVYAERTRALLTANGVADTVDLVLAPLVPLAEGSTSTWYDRSRIPTEATFGVVLVDGPPATTSPDAREPAFEAVRHLLADGALVVLDDVNRAEESRIARRWMDAPGPGRLVEERRVGRALFMRSDPTSEGEA